MTSEKSLRRHAISIVSRMPDNDKDARRVLDFIEELLDFRSVAEPEPEQAETPATILKLVPKD